jgi:hypothetical protein
MIITWTFRRFLPPTKRTNGGDALPVLKSLPKPDFNWNDWEEEE